MHLRTDTSAQSHFASVPTISRPRNSFSVAKKHVTTCQFDQLIPIYCKTIYPGDTVSVTTNVMARLQTQGWVLYDDLMFDMHSWFVPIRLIQTNWARFQFNAQPTGPTQDNSALTTPKIDVVTLGAGGFASKSLYDYLGFPTKIDLTGNTQHINNYKARAYNFVWNADYRDENLQNAVVVDLDDGPDLASDYTLLKRGKRHDKFTSALKAAQKGTPVTVPLGTTAPIILNTTNGALARWKRVSDGDEGQTIAAANWGTDSGQPANTANSDRYYYDPNGSLNADLAAAISATINQQRQSAAIQHLLEADARGGTRDVESIQHRWGVTVPDFRMQRPEYLGGTSWSFDGHVVPQTSETDQTPQGNLTMFSQALNSHNTTHSFVEHGILLVLLSARSNMTYQQGLSREDSYRTRFDYYQPEFANLGEVAMLNKEIMLQGTSADDETFGFNEYGYELRYDESIVTSEMRSNYATSLDMKHMAYDFDTLPTLSSGFIESFTPIGRNIVVQTDVADPIELNTITKGTIARTLPMFSVPGLTRF